jgi:hypothetical protein
MGATKRLAEMILQAMEIEASATKFSMVRFGNVLGSSGSVVPKFWQQIRDGGPISLTHHEITRYFMTIPEAAQLVLQASAMADGGDVFVLDPAGAMDFSNHTPFARKFRGLEGLLCKSADEAYRGGVHLGICSPSVRGDALSSARPAYRYRKGTRAALGEGSSDRWYFGHSDSRCAYLVGGGDG